MKELSEILGINEEDLKELVKKIPTPKAKKVIALRYGLNGEKELSLSEIAEQMRTTPERIRQIEAQALHFLKYNAPKKSIIEKIKDIFK